MIVFPGQGSQKIGMAKDLLANHAIARELLNETDDILDRKISTIITEGTIEELSKTENSQIAIALVSIMVIEILKQQNININTLTNYVAGHSLGEYTALYLAESLSFRDTIKLLQIRSTEMAKATHKHPGTMLAILGSDFEQIQNLITENNLDFQIANDNGGGQIVISGSKNDVTKIQDLKEQYKLKRIIPLPVSGAFHSSYMQEAADNFANYLQNTKILTPKINIYSNVTAQTENIPEKISSLLVEQIYKPVRWREIILNAHNAGENTFIEIGPSNVLTNLIKRIIPNTKTLNINSQESIEQFASSVA